MTGLAQVPLLYQPGEAWLYDTCSTLQGVLIARVCGQSLPDFLAERVFTPLGMSDTGFEVPDGKRDRFTSYYRANPAGGLELADGPDGQWSTLPQFPLGNGGLAGTADDWLAFGRMLLADGTAAGGRRLLTADSVRLMTSDHTTPAQREIGKLFLEGQGWGFGGSVDIAAIDPWNVPGRYGWVGGTGTSAHITPSTGTVAILLTQVAADGPVPPEWMRDFWRYAGGLADARERAGGKPCRQAIPGRPEFGAGCQGTARSTMNARRRPGARSARPGWRLLLAAAEPHCGGLAGFRIMPG